MTFVHLVLLSIFVVVVDCETICRRRRKKCTSHSLYSEFRLGSQFLFATKKQRTPSTQSRRRKSDNLFPMFSETDTAARLFRSTIELKLNANARIVCWIHFIQWMEGTQQANWDGFPDWLLNTRRTQTQTFCTLRFMKTKRAGEGRESVCVSDEGKCEYVLTFVRVGVVCFVYNAADATVGVERTTIAHMFSCVGVDMRNGIAVKSIRFSQPEKVPRRTAMNRICVSPHPPDSNGTHVRVVRMCIVFPLFVCSIPLAFQSVCVMMVFLFRLSSSSSSSSTVCVCEWVSLRLLRTAEYL